MQAGRDVYGQDTLQKRKKPPACDRCKAKRVLCHPNPQGCPRCREKGLECTTTPPVRRGRPRRDAAQLPVPTSKGEPTSLRAAALPVPPVEVRNIPRTPQYSLPLPPAFGPTLSPTTAARPAQILSLPPVGPSRTGTLPNIPTREARSAALTSTTSSHGSAYGVASLAVHALGDTPHFRSDASTSNGAGTGYTAATAWAPDPTSIDALAKRVSTGKPALNPELSRHLYDAFRQSPHFDEGLVPVSSLLTSLTSSDWQVDRLPLGTEALVYSAFTIGTLYSYDSSIIGPSPHTSFASLDPGSDLRVYGKRRRPAFEQMKDLAMRAARVGDVWMEPTVDNAGTCNLLDIASRIDEVMSLDAPRTRPFHRAYISHLSHLIAGDELPPGSHRSPAIRTIHLAGDVCADIGRGMVTASLEEQKIIAGPDRVRTASEVEQEYRTLLATPVREPWPDAHHICLVYITIARAMANDIFAPYRRKAPVNVSALTRSFHSILELQSLSALHGQVWDRIISKTAASSTTSDKDSFHSSVMFPHLARRRLRWTRLLAAQAVGRFGTYLWATLVVPFVSELTRRVSALFTAPDNDDSAAAAAADARTFAQQHDQAQLELLLRQARALVPLAVDAQIKLFQKSPSLALLAMSKPIGMAETFELWVDLVECGHLAGDANLASGAASAIRLGGWVYSCLRRDALVERLDFIAASSAAAPSPPPREREQQSPLGIWTQLFELADHDPVTAAATTSWEDLLGSSSVPADLVVDPFAHLHGSDLPHDGGSQAGPTFRSSAATATPADTAPEPDRTGLGDESGDSITTAAAAMLGFNAGLGTRATGPSMWPEPWPDTSTAH
ncbi:hypothetical protein JCM3774_002480 [Rhodotorula dairenensis]